MALTSGTQIPNNPIKGRFQKGGSLPPDLKKTSFLNPLVSLVASKYQPIQTRAYTGDFRQLLIKAKFLPPDLRRWHTFRNLDEEPDHLEPEPLPLCFVIHSLENVPQVDDLPKQKEKGKAEIEYFIRLSLFDVTFKRFFGKTWTGPRKSVKKRGSQKTVLHYNTPVYFHTSLTEPNIVLVAEIVGMVEDKNGRVHQLSCGWSVMRIFQQGEFADTSSGTPAPVKRVDVFHGSPRSLLYLEDDDIEGNKLITLVADCQLCYSIKTHRLMDKISHLMPENAFFSGSDVVPGIAIADDGDNFRKPKPLKKVHGVLDKVNVVLPPSIEKFEEDLCQLVNADRMAKENIQADRGAVKVAERRLHVSLHNGWEYVDKPQIVMLDADVFVRGGNRGSLSRGKQKSGLSGSRESLLSSLQVKSKIQLPSMVDDPLYAVVFLVEYIVTLPVSDQEKKLAGSMRRSQTQSYFIRWAAWTPDLSQPMRDVSMPLEGGLAHNPDQVLIYANPDDTDKGKNHGGTINFCFKLKTAGNSRPISPSSGSVASPRMLEPKPSSGAGQFPSMMSLPSQTSEGSALLEANAAVSGKPPLGRSPRRFQVSALSNYSSQGMDSARNVAGTDPGVGPHGYPFQITHLESEREGTDSMYQDQLQEMPFAPVHAPIIPTLAPTESGPGMSRAAYAYLYQAGFPVVRDRNGEPPELVDVLGHSVFRPDLESADSLQCNEIVLQFLALTRPLTQQQPVSRPDFPKTVFFTFQFYRYPAVTTERLLVAEPDNKLTKSSDNFPFILKKLKQDDITAKEDDPGWMVTYNVDAEYLKPGEGHLFIRHLFLQTLHIDVWDGDSLMLVGSCAVQLKHLLRGGREAVQISSELDIVTSEYNEAAATMTGDLSRGGSIRPVGVANILRGQLHVRLANVGHPVDKAVTRAATLPFESPKVVIQDDGSGAFLGGRLNSTARQSDARFAHLSQNRTFMASHMAEVDQEVATALFSRTERIMTTDPNQMSSKQQRKLNRMKAVRQALGNENNDKFMVKKEEKIQRTRDLKTIEIQRSLNKKEGILLMLQSVITTQHTVHPTFAAAEYFEFELRNPYNVEHTIAIQWEERELGVVTNFKELRYLKKILKLTTTNMEEGMFVEPTDDEYLGLGVQIFLKPKEKVFIPFKYQTFKTNHNVQPQGPSGKQNTWMKQVAPVDNSLESKNVKVFFRTQDNKPIAVLSLNVEPQPHIVDQTFRFQHAEQSFLKKSIRLPPFNAFKEMLGHSDLQQQVYVKCSDDNVICEAKKLPSGEPQDVFIKVACGASPSVKKFYIVIYMDPFLCKPVQIWQFYIHALHRMDVSCVEGQTQSFSLVLKGTTASRLVKCFSSHPQEMVMTPSDPFMLMANAVHEVQVYVSPKQKGSKYIYLNVVDIDYHQLVRTWLIAVTCREPVITKGFELTLPIGGGKGSNKKISYKNPYSNPKTFIVKCNRPDLVQFKETTLKMEGGETTNLGMRFAPCQYMGSVDIYIFINDQMDKNEETFLVRATYKH